MQTYRAAIMQALNPSTWVGQRQVDLYKSEAILVYKVSFWTATKKKKKAAPSRLVAHTLIPALRNQKQVNLCRFEVSLIYLVKFRI